MGRYMENLKEESVYKTVPATNLRYFSSTDCWRNSGASEFQSMGNRGRHSLWFVNFLCYRKRSSLLMLLSILLTSV
jgi:hypothetical protein